MSSAITIKLSLEQNDLVFDKNNFPANVSFDIDDNEEYNNVRIELKVAKVFHKVLNFIREESDVLEKQDFELLGEVLSKLIFGKQLDLRRQAMEETFLVLRTDVAKRCRILLNFNARSGMADLPWEYLLYKFKTIEESFYLSAASISQFQVARYYPEYASHHQPPGDKLFVILVLSLDGNSNVHPQIGSLIPERNSIIEMFSCIAELQADKFQYVIVENCCVEDLGARISEIVQEWREKFKIEPAYILHYVGHSLFDRRTQVGKVVMKKSENNDLPDWVTAVDFASVFLTGQLDVQKPSAIFFHSCDSAKIGVMNEMLQGVAFECLKTRIPAVVGMQNEINLNQSCAFYHKVYSCLLDGEDILESVTKGRDHLGNDIKDYMNRKLQPFGTTYKNNYFGSPVLFISDEPLRMIKMGEKTVEKPITPIPMNGDTAAKYGFADRAMR